HSLLPPLATQGELGTSEESGATWGVVCLVWETPPRADRRGTLPEDGAHEVAAEDEARRAARPLTQGPGDRAGAHPGDYAAPEAPADEDVPPLHDGAASGPNSSGQRSASSVISSSAGACGAARTGWSIVGTGTLAPFAG